MRTSIVWLWGYVLNKWYISTYLCPPIYNKNMWSLLMLSKLIPNVHIMTCLEFSEPHIPKFLWVTRTSILLERQVRETYSGGPGWVSLLEKEEEEKKKKELAYYPKERLRLHEGKSVKLEELEKATDLWGDPSPWSSQCELVKLLKYKMLD